MSGWHRLAAVVGTAFGGTWATYAIWASPSSPRWLLAVSGLIACASIAAIVILAAVVFTVIVEEVRPALRLRKPAAPLALSHREAAMHGSVRLRQHPVRFWGVLTFNNRFLFGFMAFGEPEYLDLRKKDEA